MQYRSVQRVRKYSLQERHRGAAASIALSSRTINTRYRYYFLSCVHDSVPIPQPSLLSLFFYPFALPHCRQEEKNLCPKGRWGWHHFYSSRKLKACPIGSSDNHEYFICIISRVLCTPPTVTHTLIYILRIPTRVHRLPSFFLPPSTASSCSSNRPTLVEPGWYRTRPP